MHYTELIEKKRDGFTHTKEEIEFIIRGVTDGSMPDYQLTAWMMAVCFRGMTDEETAYLTDAMMHSGDVVDLSDLEGIKVDKHSTGGVGDTTTLIVAPLVAACGGTVAKVSGRGLAHSGGTLDKLESVPGVSVEKSLDEFKRIVRKTGLCVIGQSGNLDPADKRMYALRDVSGTVPSIPLIASSIMSKKLASGAEAIVLDVKTGGGAFMRTVDEARKLASLMVKIGRHLGRNTVAVITDMDRPLGMAVGNGLEMREAIEGLTGKIPYNDPLMQVSFVLAGRLLMLSNIASTQEDAEIMLKKAVEDGSGFTRLRSMLEEMGGDVRYVDDPNLLVR
ncbi:MAG: thymidine phosphorylase, partial [Eubacteriales bacterium]|nr:thymidine phosphorylase [Eubacteriales bacterium]